MEYSRLLRVAQSADSSSSSSFSSGGLNMTELIDFVKEINLIFNTSYKTDGIGRKPMDKLIKTILGEYSYDKLLSSGIVVLMSTPKISDHDKQSIVLVARPAKLKKTTQPPKKIIPKPYGIKSIDRGGGGHCFYYVVAEAIKNITGKSIKMADLRKIIADHIRKNVSDSEIENVRSDIKISDIKISDIKAKREHFAIEVENVSSRAWASEPIILYTSLIFNIRFIIYMSATGTFKCLDATEDTDNFKHIVCLYYNGSHYMEGMITESGQDLFSFINKSDIGNKKMQNFFKALNEVEKLYWPCSYDPYY